MDFKDNLHIFLLERLKRFQSNKHNNKNGTNNNRRERATKRTSHIQYDLYVPKTKHAFIHAKSHVLSLRIKKKIQCPNLFVENILKTQTKHMNYYVSNDFSYNYINEWIKCKGKYFTTLLASNIFPMYDICNKLFIWERKKPLSLIAFFI